MGKKSSNQSLEDLTEMLKTLRGKEKIQDCMVRKFQKLIRNEGLTSPVVKDFPYPMVIFEQDGELIYVNRTLSDETGLYAINVSQSKHSLINCITDANISILDAVENVFLGKTTFLTGLSDPMEIFMSDRTGKKALSSKFHKAVYFPITQDEEKTTQGAVVFMK